MMTKQVVLAILLFFFPLQWGNAQQMVVPVQIQIPLLIKVVSLQKNISSLKEVYTIGIFFQKTFSKSEKAKDEIIAMGRKKGLSLLNGIPVQFVPVEVSSEKDFAQIIKDKQINAVYVTPLHSININLISEFARHRNILSMTGVPEYVEEGISVGVSAEGEKPQIVINVTASKEEGAEFSSKLLNFARIIH